MTRLVRAVGLFALGLACGAATAAFLFPWVSRVRERALLRDQMRSSGALRMEALSFKTVVAIEPYFDDRLLLGTVGEGLWIFDPLTAKTERLLDDEARPTTGVITCILRGPGWIFGASYTGEEYWLRPSSAAQGRSAYAAYYSCDANGGNEYLLALWRELAFWSPKKPESKGSRPSFTRTLMETGIVSAVFLAEDQIAWSRTDGGVFRGRLNEGNVSAIEPLPSLPVGLNSLVWFGAGEKLFATHSDRSYELDGNLWRPLIGRGGSPMKVLSCKHVVGQGCWVFSHGSLGMLRPDGRREWIFHGFPFKPVVAYADLRSGRVFIGTVGGGLVSVSLDSGSND